MTTATLSIMLNPRRRAIRQSKAARLRNERGAQRTSGIVVIMAVAAVVAMLVLGPY